MKRLRVVTLLLLCAFTVVVAVNPRDIDKVKKEREAAKREIRETTKKLTATERETQKGLNRLNSLRAEISNKSAEIGVIQSGIDSIDKCVKIVTDSISVLEAQRAKLRDKYAESLRKTQSSLSSVNALSFLFSVESFGQAYQRMRYIRQFADWRKRKTDEIQQVTDSLEFQHSRLDSLQLQRQKDLTKLSIVKKQLQSNQSETNKLVANLKKESGTLRSILKQKEQKAKALDREVERLIAAQQNSNSSSSGAAKNAAGSKGRNGKAANNNVVAGNAAADRALSGSFESNKGNLLFPVSGKYKIVRGFGRQRHPDLEHVETENSGIDIEVGAGAVARSIFKGKVSAIFEQPGYNKIVMVRHGNYLSIYANLSSINVKMGDDVSANQPIGSIYVDPEDDNRAILHFELRKERTKLNPMQWVK